MLRARPHNISRLFAGWLFVAVWLLALPGVAPSLFAALAWMEGSHGIELRDQGSEVCVVLTHGARNVTRTHDQIHRHCLFARILVSIAASGGGQPDHFIKFASANSAELRKSTAVTAETIAGEILAPHLVEIVPLEIPVFVAREDTSGDAPLPPIFPPNGTSTVLLI